MNKELNEMRRKVYLAAVLTIGLLTFYRFLLFVPLPGVDQAAMAEMLKKPAASQEAPTQWTEVGPGIGYRDMTMPGPVRVFIARADRSRDTWTVDSMTSMGTIKGGHETVPDMAKRYDDTVTWDGHRYEVKAAINGDYHDRTTGYAFGGQVIAGWYAKRFGDDGGMSGFFWTASARSAGMCTTARGSSRSSSPTRLR
jgi:hypothetical protein